MTWRKGNRLKLVPESQATGPTAEVFADMKHTLGIPNIDGMYQALAAYPDFLRLHWEAVRPVSQTQEFFSLAERVRADCYTRIHGYFAVPDLCTHVGDFELSTGAREELTSVVDLYNYSTPFLLLLIAAQFYAFESPVGQAGGSAPAADHPNFVQSVVLVSEDSAPPVIHRVYEDIKRTLALPFLPSFYLSIARWPDFLHIYWDTLKPILRSPVYEGCQYGSRETAFALVREFPVPVELSLAQLSEAGVSDEDIGSIVRILETFVSALSGMVLNVAVAKIGLEGGTGASAHAGRVGPKSAPTKETERAA